MSKSEHFQRYGAIINKLRNNQQATFDEIYNHLKKESEFTGYNLTVSKRTFQRDLDEIRSLFNVVIQFDFSRQVYRIVEDNENNDLNNRMLEAFEMFNSLNVASDNSRYIYFEKRKPHGLENLYGLLHAIKNRLIIRFVYLKFWETEPTTRDVEPYSLKEFKGRWYVYGKDLNGSKIKTFGLDRITELDITRKRFIYPKDVNVIEIFRNCFGIEGPGDGKPEDIILSFEPVQGQYIKSFPLHESQKILKDTAGELQISLRLYITHDFLMELLSYGHKLKVISPKHLKDKVCEEYTEALKKYPSGTKSKLKKSNKKTYFLLEDGHENNSFLKDNVDFGTMEHGTIE